MIETHVIARSKSRQNPCPQRHITSPKRDLNPATTQRYPHPLLPGGESLCSNRQHSKNSTRFNSSPPIFSVPSKCRLFFAYFVSSKDILYSPHHVRSHFNRAGHTPIMWLLTLDERGQDDEEVFKGTYQFSEHDLDHIFCSGWLIAGAQTRRNGFGPGRSTSLAGPANQ